MKAEKVQLQGTQTLLAEHRPVIIKTHPGCWMSPVAPKITVGQTEPGGDLTVSDGYSGKAWRTPYLHRARLLVLNLLTALDKAVAIRAAALEAEGSRSTVDQPEAGGSNTSST
jgi:hypothetical protein